MSELKVRVRFAPSPTGYLHVGGFRTALYNYLFAKKHSGTFILRIEDTDQKRFVSGALENLVDILDTMGLVHDEGVFTNHELQTVYSDNEKVNHAEAKESANYPTTVEVGTYGPYIQSERLPLYQEYAEKLIANGKAYYCFCSAERLEQVRAEQTKNKQAPKYDKHCLSLSPDAARQKLEAGEAHVIRLNVSDARGDIVFDDLVRDQVKIHVKDIDDQVLMKSDGFPTYHLANVVDDHLMEITHVIRGEEWLPSTPKHILLYEAFGWETPQFAHIPLLLNPDKSKLSKRQGDVAVEDYLKKGYLKEALINFVALLGWNPGAGSTQEIFTLDELVQAFDLHQVHKAGAVFDLKKLDWMNAEYIKKLPIDELYEKISGGGFLEKPFIADAPEAMRSEKHLKRVLTIERERLARLSDVGEQNLFFFATDPVYDPQKLSWKENPAEATKASLERAYAILSDMSDEEWEKRETLEKILLDAAGEKRGDFLWPIRFALTGADRSPSPFDVAWVLGKDESLKRIQNALKMLS